MIKKYKIIALMTCRIRDRECYKLVNVLNKRFSETDFRLFVYNCSPRLDEYVKENDSQTSVYNMFDAYFADAVIIDSDHIGNAAVCKKIISRALGMNLLVILLGECFDGCINIFYEIMQSIIKHKPQDDSVYDFIQKKRDEGKCGKEAMIAGLNKFLRVYYGRVMEIYSSETS